MASDSEDEMIKKDELRMPEDVLKGDELEMKDDNILKIISVELKLKENSDLQAKDEDGLLVTDDIQLKNKEVQLEAKEGVLKMKEVGLGIGDKLTMNDELESEGDEAEEVELIAETEDIKLKKTVAQEKDDLKTKELDIEKKDELKVIEFDFIEKNDEEKLEIELKLKDDEVKMKEKLRIEQELKIKEDELKMRENELRTKENELKMKENELKMKENALKTKEVALKRKKSDDLDQNESQLSCFTVDGVVAEMDIEVEEDDCSLHKDLKLNEINIQESSSNDINEIDLTLEDSGDEINSHDMSIVIKQEPDDTSENKESFNNEAADPKEEMLESSGYSQGKPFKKRGRKRKFEVNKEETALKRLNFEEQNKKTEQVSLDTSGVEMKTLGSKKNSLRKLPFRKNLNAPDVPDLQPKVIWINDVGEGSGIHLGNLPKLRKQILEAKRKLRLLYKLLYFQVPPNDPSVVKAIFKFNGFPFDESSFEFVKRKRVLSSAADTSVLSICKMLNLRKGSKQEMVKNILKFLMKPHGKLDPPDDPVMQPRVVLERISLDSKYLKDALALYTSRHAQGTKKPQAQENLSRENISTRYNLKDKSRISWNKKDHRSQKIEKLLPNKTSLKESDKDKERKSTDGRKRIETKNKPAGRRREEEKRFEEERKRHEEKRRQVEQKRAERKKQEEKKEKERKIQEEGKTQEKKKHEEKQKKQEVGKKKEEEGKKKEEEEKKEQEDKKKQGEKKTEKKRDNIEKTINKDIETKKKKKNMDGSIKKSKQAHLTSNESEDIGKKDIQKYIQISKSSKILKEDESVKPKNTENIQKIENPLEEILFPSDNEDTDDAPESQNELIPDDSIIQSSAVKSETEKKSPSKKVLRLGKPLRMFPKINEQIKNASFNVLQRLHILLFGAFDKAANLKPNILAFGGFPFVEGSEEWKQKQFLMSLLAQNTLREYLDLLCIEYSGNDQKTMISKLMKFLTAPNENSLGEHAKEKSKKTISSEPTPAKKKSVKKEAANKDAKKKPTKEPSSKSHRKVLMDEDQVRRMEADIAREQRILAREKKLNDEQMQKFLTARQDKDLKTTVPGKTLAVTNLVPPTKPPIADPEQLNALLQTVYKRRALKAAGAVISTPKKEKITRLGDIPNVKFLIVTGNYSDLAMLHHLIYKTDTNKAKVRKNILDFCGFGFTEESSKYQERMVFLNSEKSLMEDLEEALFLKNLHRLVVGYDLSKRIAFLLGLCPYQTTIAQQDLNELILYFLMSPCRTKQVPITHFPQKLLDKSCSSKTVGLTKREDSILSVPSSDDVLKKLPEKDAIMVIDSQSPIDSPNLNVVLPQKAKKSINGSSSKLHSVKKVILPSASQKPALLNRVPATKMPSPSKMVTTRTVLVPPPGFSGPRLQAPQSMSSPAQLEVKKGDLKSASTPNLDEYFFQQQTPDGQQKTYKLIRLPQNHPLATTVMRNTAQQMASPPTPPIQINTTFTSALPPGIILVRNKPPAVTSQSVPNVTFSTPTRITTPVLRPQLSVKPPDNEEYVLPDQEGDSSTEGNTALDDDVVDVFPPLKENPPSDKDLYTCIQDIIHSSNFENMTLKNVLDEVCAKFPNHDLTQRHSYMKECIKSIIIGT